AVHRTQHGCGLCACRPHPGACSRNADRPGHPRNHPRRPSGCRGLLRKRPARRSPAMSALTDLGNAAPTRPMLEVRGLQAWYGRAQVLFGVDVRIAAGEVLALMGRNGAGKSTTIRAIMGLLDAIRGDIVFEGSRIERLPAFRIARLGIGYVPEDRRIFTDLTVLENLETGRRPPRQGVPHWTVERVFELF